MFKNNPKVAFTVFGAIENFIKVSNYPVFGNGEIYYSRAKNVLAVHKNTEEIERWTAAGAKMTIEQALLYVVGS